MKTTKILSTALLYMALSPLTYANTPYCENWGVNHYGGDRPAQATNGEGGRPSCETNGRIDVPNNNYVNFNAVSKKNSIGFTLSSSLVPTAGAVHIIRNVSWGKDSIYINKNFSGQLIFKQKQTLGKTHTFFGKVGSYTSSDMRYKPYVALVIWSSGN